MTATRLGAVRAGVCLVFFFQGLRTSGRDLGSLPDTLMHLPGVMQLLSWSWYDRLLTPHGMMLFKGALLTALLLAAIGYCTRETIIAAAALELIYQGVLRSYGHFNHDEMAGMLILLVLACTPCGDGFSLDALTRQPDTPRPPATRYGYPIALMQAIMAWAYCSAGLLKLRIGGLAYFRADELPVTAIRQSLDNLHDTALHVAFALPAMRAVLPVALAITVCWEILFPVALVVPRLRRVWLPLGLIFHVATMVMMNITFWNMMGMYLIFVDWPRVGNMIRRRWPIGAIERLRRWMLVPEFFPATRVAVPQSGGILLWDGTCGFCARMVERLQRVGARRVTAQAFQEYHGLPAAVSPWTARQMHWITADGSIVGGGTALVAAVRATGRPVLAALLDCDVLRPFNWLGYRLVASNRDTLGPLAGVSCALPEPAND